MENYIKYTLKPEAELQPLLAATDDLFVIACGKCYKKLHDEAADDLGAFLQLAEKAGKHITGIAKPDFLCNKTKAETKLMAMIPEGTKAVFVIGCGLGIQTVAELAPIPVFAACDSLNYTGHHGMAITDVTCGACAQCYLNMTGGICPIVDCSKSLVNGQCGGAKNGKCEVSPDKDCAWEKIQQRLAEQGRLEELAAQSVQVRDYSKVNYKKINEYVKAIRQERFAGYYGGVHPSEHKEGTEHMRLVPFPEQKVVAINLAQHAGAPATPIVSVGDHVDVGQKVGEAAGFISANLHASVSGTVIAVEDRLHATRGNQALSVVIENDGKYTIHESCKPYGALEDLAPADIVAAVKEAGIIGMGGAGFPLYVKLMPKTPIDTVLLNGCECEPWLTADHRIMLEYADDVIYGLQAICKAVSSPKGIIVVEDNKPDAIALLQEKVAGIPGIEVFVAKTKYPQGGEKMLIKNVMGRQVPRGGLPSDVGCVVANVSTSKAVSDVLKKGLPIVERAVTVTGEKVARPGNFLVRIGTSVDALLEHCGADLNDSVVKLGGPMMGAVQKAYNAPTTKCTNGVTVYNTDVSEPNECIQCGRCVDVCPMELKPLYFAKYAGQQNWQGFKEQNVMDCMECRCCEFICSSKLPLVSFIRTGKAAVREMK